jgi:hypothetical protein
MSSSGNDSDKTVIDKAFAWADEGETVVENRFKSPDPKVSASPKPGAGAAKGENSSGDAVVGQDATHAPGAGNRDDDVPPSLAEFRGWKTVRQFSARGGEADILLVEKDDKQRILKLYRYGIDLKSHIIEKIAVLGKEYPERFVVIHDFGFDQGTRRFFELQEFFPLGTLKDVFPETKLPEATAMQIITQIAYCLRILHDQNILHCDLKPNNILVRSRDPLSVVLTDFGIASLLDEEFSKKMTDVKGTSLYQSPESLSGVIGAKSDWWALGMIALELLTGRNPFESLQRQVIFYHLTTRGVSIPGGISPRNEKLVKGLLTRNPDMRWGGEEFRRWGQGENVPDYYEEPIDDLASAEEVSAAKLKGSRILTVPYTFMGKNFKTLESLVEAFTFSEAAWCEAKAHFMRGYLRKWLEENKEYDRANILAGVESKGGGNDLMLFRFMYAVRRDLPLTWMGQRVDQAFIYKIFDRALTGNPADCEAVFLENVFTGKLFREDFPGTLPPDLTRIIDMAAHLCVVTGNISLLEQTKLLRFLAEQSIDQQFPVAILRQIVEAKTSEGIKSLGKAIFDGRFTGFFVKMGGEMTPDLEKLLATAAGLQQIYSGQAVDERSRMLLLALGGLLQEVTPVASLKAFHKNEREAQVIFDVVKRKGFLDWASQENLVPSERLPLWKWAAEIVVRLEKRPGKAPFASLLALDEINDANLESGVKTLPALSDLLLAAVFSYDPTESAIKTLNAAGQQLPWLVPLLAQSLGAKKGADLDATVQKQVRAGGLRPKKTQFERFLLPPGLEAKLTGKDANPDDPGEFAEAFEHPDILPEKRKAPFQSWDAVDQFLMGRGIPRVNPNHLPAVKLLKWYVEEVQILERSRQMAEKDFLQTLWYTLAPGLGGGIVLMVVKWWLIVPVLLVLAAVYVKALERRSKGLETVAEQLETLTGSFAQNPDFKPLRKS